MKKIYFLFLAIAFSATSFAQIPTNDMEGWRTTNAVGTPSIGHTAVPVEAPYHWYGSDSTIIALGQTLGPLVGADDTDWRRQIFKESAAMYVHGGASSAKIMTRNEFTFTIPGVLTNAIPSVGISAFPTPTVTAVSLKGGSPIAAKPTSVSAWVQYFPGAGGVDSGSLSVQVLGQVGGKDSVIGTGFVTIGPSSSWVLVTANITYPLHTNVPVDTFRIALSSGKGASGNDSSTLYADDLSMTTVPNPDNSAVPGVTVNDVVKVFPNPANGALFLSCADHERFRFELVSVNGRVAAEKAIAGSDALNVTHLPAGMYFYVVYDAAGIAVQRGKVTLNK